MKQSDTIIITAYQKGLRVKNGKLYNKLGKEVKTWPNKAGYACFTVRDKYSKSVTFPVHRLTAFQKFGMFFFTQQCTRHLNANRLDFSLENIECGSYTENSRDIPAKERQRLSIQASVKIRKYSPDFVLQIRKEKKEGLTYGQILDKYPEIKGKGSLFNILNSDYLTDSILTGGSSS